MEACWSGSSHLALEKRSRRRAYHWRKLEYRLYMWWLSGSSWGKVDIYVYIYFKGGCCGQTDTVSSYYCWFIQTISTCTDNTVINTVIIEKREHSEGECLLENDLAGTICTYSHGGLYHKIQQRHNPWAVYSMKTTDQLKIIFPSKTWPRYYLTLLLANYYTCL